VIAIQWKPTNAGKPLEAECAVEHLMQRKRVILSRFLSLFHHHDQRAERRRKVKRIRSREIRVKAISNHTQRIFIDQKVFISVPSYAVSIFTRFETLVCIDGLLIPQSQ
jgi:hypothetical protein